MQSKTFQSPSYGRMVLEEQLWHAHCSARTTDATKYFSCPMLLPYHEILFLACSLAPCTLNVEAQERPQVVSNGQYPECVPTRLGQPGPLSAFTTTGINKPSRGT